MHVCVDPPPPPLISLVVMLGGLAMYYEQYEELARFAARVQGLLLAAWEESTCLREIMVETIAAREVEVRLFSKVGSGNVHQI